MKTPLLFTLEPHPLLSLLCEKLPAEQGQLERRAFPDGESYLRIHSAVNKRHCIILANLSRPDAKYLPLVFLASTLRELGAASVALVAPYLSYMRQDRRFVDGEAVTSKIFAQDLSRHVDWLVTVDPHLHRYHSLDEIYTIPNRVVRGETALAQWLKQQHDLLLIGPDAESEQWVKKMAEHCAHPYVIGNKQRHGDRDVEVFLPDLSGHKNKIAVIIDDVISSGQTILQCLYALQAQKFQDVQCAAVHGIFADHSDDMLLDAGLSALITSNSIPHSSNTVDISDLLCSAVRELL